MKDTQFKDLIGKTLTAFKVLDDKSEIHITCSDGTSYRMYHAQECCEFVAVEDICGDIADMLNSPVLQAEESSNTDNPPEFTDEEFLWTFYRMHTAKGSLVIRWLGQSNGYYGVSVSFKELDNRESKRIDLDNT
jgi:hypothetical protein